MPTINDYKLLFSLIKAIFIFRSDYFLLELGGNSNPKIACDFSL